MANGLMTVGSLAAANSALTGGRALRLDIYGFDTYYKVFSGFRGVDIDPNDWDNGRLSPGSLNIGYPERVPFLHACLASKWELFSWAPYFANENFNGAWLRATYFAVLWGQTIGEQPAGRLWNAVAQTGQDPNKVFYEFEREGPIPSGVSLGPAPKVAKKPPPSIIPEVWQPRCSVDTARAMDAVRAMSRGVNK